MQLPPDGLLQVESTIVFKDDTLGIPISASVGHDGTLYIADLANSQVLAVSTGGQVLWRVGRAGSGPGEFRTLYRVAATPDGGLLAFDRNASTLTEFDARGNYIRTARLPFQFSQIDQIVSLAGGVVAIAGRTHWGGYAADSAIHLFDHALRHIRSFAPVPRSRESWVLDFWGVGGLTRASDGLLLYTRRIPYEVYRYSSNGEGRRMVIADLEGRPFPDDVIKVATTATGRRTYSQSDADIEIPLTAHELQNGWILAGRRRGANRQFEYYAANGELIGSTTVPAATRVIGLDSARNRIWVQAEIDGVPVFFLYTVKYD